LKKAIAVVVLLIAGALAMYEWSYSSDMQDHIDRVNQDIQGAKIESLYSTGLLGQLNSMTSEDRVANEIFRTQDHVHTLKDRALADKVKQIGEDGVTVGGAIHLALERWSSLI
jgi:hypothetical protein